VETVGDCLLSVEEQTWANREHIIIDGISSDGTLEVLARHRDDIAVLVSEPDRGIYDALNKGIARASGDVVGFLHADDLFAGPEALARIGAAFEDPGVCAAYGDLLYVRRGDVEHVVRYWRTPPFNRRRLAWGWMPPHPTLYVRREWYERIGGFDTRYRIAADYFSVLSLFGNPEFRAVHVPEVLVKMRLGGASNRSLRNILRKSREDLDALRRSGVGALGGFGAIAWKNLSKIAQFVPGRPA
jgi:glycosyltransferase